MCVSGESLVYPFSHVFLKTSCVRIITRGLINHSIIILEIPSPCVWGALGSMLGHPHAEVGQLSYVPSITPSSMMTLNCKPKLFLALLGGPYWIFCWGNTTITKHRDSIGYLLICIQSSIVDNSWRWGSPSLSLYSSGWNVTYTCGGITPRTEEILLGVVAHTFKPSTHNAEAGGSRWVWSQPGLQSEFQDIQGCYTKKEF